MTDTSEVDIKLCNDLPAKRPLQRSFSTGTRYPLINEGECQVCRISHHKNLIQKIIFSRLRRWENHHLILSDSHITSYTVSSLNLFYTSILGVMFIVLHTSSRIYILYILEGIIFVSIYF